jgi:protocatechuate 3,4-dioxygenase beta subunit
MVLTFLDRLAMMSTQRPDIHVRVQPAGGTILTTQLYFPNEPANDADSLFNPVLLLKLTPNVSPLEASFDFVLKT